MNIVSYIAFCNKYDYLLYLYCCITILLYM